MRVQEDDILSYSQFKQYNIIAAKMFQHAIDPSYQERISVEGIYDVRNTLATHPALEPITRKPKRKLGQTLGFYWGSIGSLMAAIALV